MRHGPSPFEDSRNSLGYGSPAALPHTIGGLVFTFTSLSTRLSRDAGSQGAASALPPLPALLATPCCVPAWVNCRWSTSPRPTTSFATTHKHETICTSISRDNTPIYPISYLQNLLAGQRSLMLASPQMRVLSVSRKAFQLTASCRGLRRCVSVSRPGETTVHNPVDSS
jgi:hypothetical protein